MIIKWQYLKKFVDSLRKIFAAHRVCCDVDLESFIFCSYVWPASRRSLHFRLTVGLVLRSSAIGVGDVQQPEFLEGDFLSKKGDFYQSLDSCKHPPSCCNKGLTSCPSLFFNDAFWLFILKTTFCLCLSSKPIYSRHLANRMYTGPLVVYIQPRVNLSPMSVKTSIKLSYQVTRLPSPLKLWITNIS